MAGIDSYNLFTGTAASPVQALQTTSTTTASTNYIDMGEGKDAFGNVLTNPDPGMGKPLFVNIVCTTTPTATGSGTTIKFDLQSGPDSGGTGTSQAGTCTAWTTIASTSAIPIADFVKGYTTFIAVPPYMQQAMNAISGGVSSPATQYLQIQQTTGTSTQAGGYYSAWLSGEPVSTV